MISGRDAAEDLAVESLMTVATKKRRVVPDRSALRPPVVRSASSHEDATMLVGPGGPAPAAALSLWSFLANDRLILLYKTRRSPRRVHTHSVYARARYVSSLVSRRHTAGYSPQRHTVGYSPQTPPHRCREAEPITRCLCAWTVVTRTWPPALPSSWSGGATSQRGRDRGPW